MVYSLRESVGAKDRRCKGRLPTWFVLSRPGPDERQFQTLQRGGLFGTSCYVAAHEYIIYMYDVEASLIIMLQPVPRPEVPLRGPLKLLQELRDALVWSRDSPPGGESSLTMGCSAFL